MATESALLERITTLREKAETAALNYADAKAGLARAEFDLLELRFGIKPGVVVEKDGIQYRIEKIERYWRLDEQPWLTVRKRTKAGWHSKTMTIFSPYVLRKDLEE